MSHPAERVHRRRSSRRSHAIRRSTGVLVLLILIACGAWSAHLYFFAPSSSNIALSSDSMSSNADQNLVARAREAVNTATFGRSQRAVYPYSVVPGGVQTPQELREASEHDGIVAAHYAGFDFRHAKLIQVKQAKLVYVSYRIGEKVFWTRKQMSLRVGENLITDGRTTARTRCGNQVSEIPQLATSPAEPSMETLDQLIPEPAAPPVPFESALLHPPEFGVTALPPLGGLPPGSILPPPIGGGGCTPRPGHPCYPPPPPSPPPPVMAEPDAPSLLGSMLLFWLGVAGMHWRQKKLKMR